MRDCTDLWNWGSHTSTLGWFGKNSTDNSPVTLFLWGESGYQSPGYYETVWSGGVTGAGIGKINADNVVGINACNDKSIIILEKAPEYTIERWNLDPSAVFTGKSAGGFGDDDDKFNNPIDVTCDALELVYVLDKLSNGQPRIKVFSKDLVSLGGIGDSTLIPGTPIALDFDKKDNALHVLTSQGVVVIAK